MPRWKRPTRQPCFACLAAALGILCVCLPVLAADPRRLYLPLILKSLPIFSPTPSVGRVLISEALVNPAAIEPDAEWIELYNAGGAAVDLSVYKLGDEETPAGSEGMMQFPAGAWLQPGQVIVVANQSSVFAAWYGFLPDYELLDTDARVPDLFKYYAWAERGIELTNGGDELLLLDGDDQPADGLAWGASLWPLMQPALSSPPDGASFERRPAWQDTDAALDWVLQGQPAPGKVNLTALPAAASPTPTPSAANPSATPSNTLTAASTPFLQPSPTLSSTPSPIFSLTPSPSALATLTPTATRTVKTTRTHTPSPTLTPTSTLVPNLAINEINADPGGDANGDGVWDTSQDEFVEIVNLTAAPVDLSGWTLHDSIIVRHIFPPGSILAPYQAALVFGGGAPQGDFGGSLVQTASTGYLTLGNSGDTVALKTPHSLPFLAYAYGEEAGQGQSLTRDPDFTGGFIPHTQAAAAGGRICSPGVKIDGTPFSSSR